MRIIKFLYQRGKFKVWYHDFIYRGNRYVGCIGQVSLMLAKEELTRRRAEVVEGKLNPAKIRRSPRFEGFVGEYLEWSKANRKPRSYARDVTSLVTSCSFFTGQKLSDINL